MDARVDRVPVYLLTGFLGRDKTMILNALVNAPAFANTAVIVNEFGEIGLDHFLIERSQDNAVLLEAGCLCCTIADSLHETLTNPNFPKNARRDPGVHAGDCRSDGHRGSRDVDESELRPTLDALQLSLDS